MLALSRVNKKRRAIHLAPAFLVKLAKSWNQSDREIIHAVEPEIFKRIEDRPFARTGKAGKNYELPCVTFTFGALHGVRG